MAKKLAALVIAAAVAFTTVGGYNYEVQAAETLADNSSSVILKNVNNEQEFRNYIDEDGAFASYDELLKGWNDNSDVHQIVIPEDGTLIVASLGMDDCTKFELFSNFALTAKIGEDDCIRNVRDDFEHYSLDKGTYYYRINKWNGGDPSYVYTYLGFEPKSGNLSNDTGKKSTTVVNAKPVTLNPLTTIDGLKTYISENGAEASKDTITTDWIGNSDLYEVNVTEPGWLAIATYSDKDDTYWNLYSNSDLSAKLMELEPDEKFDAPVKYIYLEPGKYYYNVVRWNGYDPVTTTTYLGFVSTKSRISVTDIKLSQDKCSATITFDYDKSFLPSVTSGLIRVERGVIQPRNINNGDVWHTDTRENALESNQFTVTANGTYTARIENSKDICSGMINFEVTGLKTGTPAKAKVSSAKKNSKKISGTAPAYMKVVIKVDGKSYSTKANKSGKWSLNTGKKLKKGSVIKITVKNSAGKSSKVLTYKVK